MKAPRKIGDRSSSDVVVRIRTQDGRDEWIYCHSHILIEKSKYFADRLSENWPTCQILDSRNCVEVHCEESDFNYHVIVLRLLYAVIDGSVCDIWHGVKNALGILRVAFELGCPQIITACVNYLEAVPWEESEEDEILRTIPGMGPQVEPILARLQPVNPSAVMGIFLSSLRFATSSPPPQQSDLKISAQEQLEYMLTEDDDSPLIVADEEIKNEVRDCIKELMARFNNLLETLSCESELTSEEDKMRLFFSYLSDLSWACQILTKLEIMREFSNSWVDASQKIVQLVERANSTCEIILQTKLKVVEVAAKVLEAIGNGTVILPTARRLCMVKLWLPFVRVTKPLIDSVITNSEDTLELKVDGELWQCLESTLVSIILTLPSEDQANILTEWLGNEHVKYPDLTEAFEVWCYRSKVSKRKLSMFSGNCQSNTPS